MRIPYIEQKAEAILHSTNCYSLPVNVSKCASQLNIIVNDIDLSAEVSGFFTIKGGDPQIGVNLKHPQNRKRFTIAHEIGHFILHKDEGVLFVDKFNVPLFRDTISSSGEIQREKEANSFAAALLMPEKLIDQEIEKFYNEENHDKELIDYLHKKFAVSKNAMTFRLINLEKIDIGYKDSLEL
jgi:Zn-dependent peptidase ImmA (M78 family)